MVYYDTHMVYYDKSRANTAINFKDYIQIYNLFCMFEAVHGLEIFVLRMML